MPRVESIQDSVLSVVRVRPQGVSLVSAASEPVAPAVSVRPVSPLVWAVEVRAFAPWAVPPHPGPPHSGQVGLPPVSVAGLVDPGPVLRPAGQAASFASEALALRRQAVAAEVWAEAFQALLA